MAMTMTMIKLTNRLLLALVLSLVCRCTTTLAHQPDAEDALNEGERIEARQVPREDTRSLMEQEEGDVGCMKQTLSLEYLSERYGIDVNNATPDILEALLTGVTGQLGIGSTTELICEANDASRTDALVQDGFSGDVNFPFGKIKPLATVGELNYCVNDEARGDAFTGVPDGMGAYLVDDETIRIVVQSESYGTISQQETWPYKVNGGVATFTGSHVHYLDFDRYEMAHFMTHDRPASEMLKAFGQVAETYYNLAGDFVNARNTTGATSYGAHFSNTDKDGNYAVVRTPTQADWIMQSLCSSHLEEKHQWGTGIGFEDNVYITNEEWITYEDGKEFVGISAHIQDLDNRVDYAIGSVTNTGFEKIVELNSQHKDYIILAVSGYNGDYSGNSAELDARNAEYGNRPDGQPYVWTKNICPARIYVGVKGKMEDGSLAVDEDDFLARNGLRYGKLYGFATDIGISRDDYHKNRANGDMVAGKFVAINWQWDGVVKNYRHDGAWEFQLDVPGNAGWEWWNANGRDSSGAKTEHLSPDTRIGHTAFIQGSTAGYFGHYYLKDVTTVLDSANGMLPAEFAADYYVYQGEQDITGQVDLGNAGLYALRPDICPFTNDDGDVIGVVNDARHNCDRPLSAVKSTFEDIDGLEVIAAKEGLYAIIQEDSGNELGERMFISKLEHSGTELSYKFIAMSGGAYNTRMAGGVGIPAGSNSGGNAHEFSGVIDLSGMLAMVESVGDDDDDAGGERDDDEVPEVTDADGPVGRLYMFVRNFTTYYYNPDGSLYMVKANSTEYYFPEEEGRRLSGTMPDNLMFAIPAGNGHAKRMVEMDVSINNKLIALGLQAHNLEKVGAIEAFQTDRGGQVLLYQPDMDVVTSPTTIAPFAPVTSAPAPAEPTQTPAPVDVGTTPAPTPSPVAAAIVEVTEVVRDIELTLGGLTSVLDDNAQNVLAQTLEDATRDYFANLRRRLQSSGITLLDTDVDVTGQQLVEDGSGLTTVYDQSITYSKPADLTVSAESIVTEPLASADARDQFVSDLKAADPDAFADLTGVSAPQGPGSSAGDDDDDDTTGDADQLSPSSKPSDDRSAWVAHGVFASLAWGILVPLAVGASFIRKVFVQCGLPKNTWFKIHVALNGTAILFTVISFAIAMSLTTHRTTTHHNTGVAVLVLTLLQGLGGLLGALTENENKQSMTSKYVEEATGRKEIEGVENLTPEEAVEGSKAEDPHDAPPHDSIFRLAWEIGHRLLGAVLLGLAWWQVQSGLKLFADRFQEDSIDHVFWIVLAVILGAIGVLALYQRIALK